MKPPIRCPAYLLIRGDNLAPSQISELLGATPRVSAIKGAELINEDTGKKYKSDTGKWVLTATDPDCKNLDWQIDEILKQLTGDLTIWNALSKSYDLILFCGLFMEEDRHSLSVSSNTLLALGERGINFEFDIFENIS